MRWLVLGCALWYLARTTALGIASAAPRRSMQPEPRAVLVAVGDISLARGIGSPKRPEAVLDGIRPSLSSADVVFGNLECVLSVAPVRRGLPVALRANPASMTAFSGLPPLVVSVANNHSLDCGGQGLSDTLAALHSHRIHAVGGGFSLSDAQRPGSVTVNGLRIAVVAFSEFSALRPATGATISPATLSAVRETVTTASKQADVVVVAFHWGIEGQGTPTDHQRALARAAVDAGAVLVVGSHPHVLQGVEWLPGRHGRSALVAYSLGNFVFDSRLPEMNQSALVFVSLARDGIESARLAPVTIRHGLPGRATEAEATVILKRVAHLSSILGTTVQANGELGRAH